ncbi:hypothetical protein O77CONTIG1_01841 [Leptolyngbya sp. O-77]|nr:hypothetical protein O77CONTIG1_01841 [Leptolyngbya sp. O-77]
MIAHPPVFSHMNVNGIEVNNRIQLSQRAVLPLTHLVTDRIG